MISCCKACQNMLAHLFEGKALIQMQCATCISPNSTFIPNYGNQQASLLSMFEEFHSLDFWGERINSRKHSNSCIIIANWTKNGGQINCESTNDSRAGIINYFF